jgi:peptidyl-tRNA hydrolase, PTH1 family
MSGPRFLLLSLGNTAPYHETYHSAGHLALRALQHALPLQPPFTTERHGKKQTMASMGPKYMMIQSPTLMNVSGPWVAETWKELSRQYKDGLQLLIVHDDLEEPLGEVKLRSWRLSHRGHNGIKSIYGSLPWQDHSGGGKDVGRFDRAKISIGIGRPGKRDKSSVSDFVLTRIPGDEKQVLAESVTQKLPHILRQLENDWVRKVEEARRKEQLRLEKAAAVPKPFTTTAG